MISKGWWTLLGALFLLSLVLRYDLLFLFTILLGLASGASILWSRYCLHGVTYRRKLKDDRIFSGEETDLAVEVTNAKPLPLAWLLIRDEFPKDVSLLTGMLGTAEQQETAVLSLTDMLSLRWYERVQRIYRVRGDRRGVYEFGPASITSGDIFGFGDKQALIETKDRLTVYPKVVPIEELVLPSERPAGELKARRKIIEDPLRMATVREYIPGDSIRHIHWKNTARLNRLQTKVFDPSASHVLDVFVDLQTAHNPYTFVTEYLELIISAAASVSLHALNLRYAVGLYANGGPRDAGHWTVVPAGRSPGQGMQILDALAPLTGFRLLPLHQLLRRAMPALHYGSTVLAITARAIEPVLASLLTLQDAGHPIVLLTVGEQPEEIPETFTTFHLGGRDAWHRLETLELA
jgi:uncharacterized protein (DUF58 family)